MPNNASYPPRKNRFAHLAGLVEKPIRRLGEKRGFAQMRLLTHWGEIVGQDIATMCQPVRITYAQEGLGGTLIVQCNAAHAPLVDMQAPEIQTRVNASFGYNAVRRVRVNQGVNAGFAEKAAVFAHKSAQTPPPATQQHLQAQAQSLTKGIENPDLRAALENLGTNVMRKTKGELG